MLQTFGISHPTDGCSSAHSYGENGRLGTAKKEAPERANVRGFGHSITAIALEQHMNSNPLSRQTALGGAE